MFFLVWLAGSCCATGASAAPATLLAPQVERVWTDRSGKRHAIAKLIDVQGDNIHLVTPFGAIRTIRLSNLSAADQELVKTRVAEVDSLTPRPEQPPRTWTDRSGGRRVTATFIGLRGERVLFRRPSGKLVLASLESLHPDDQQFVKTLLRQNVADRTLTRPSVENTAGLREHGTRGLTVEATVALVKALRPLAPGGQLMRGLPRFERDETAIPQVPARVAYIRVSRPYLEHFLAQSFQEVDSIRDVVVGTPIRGNSHTTGRATIALVPSRQGAVTDLFVVGKSEAETVGYHWPVQVYGHATTQFSARKRIILGANGAQSLPSATNARTQTTTSGISSMLPGLRGRISQRIAGRVVEQTRGQANAETARHVEQRVDRRLDENVGMALARLNGVNRLLAAARASGLDLHLAFRTTTDHLHVVLAQDAAAGSEFAFDPPTMSGDPHVAVWVRRDLAQRVIADAALSQVFQPLFSAAVLQSELSTSGTASVKQPHYRFGWSDDARWLTVGLTMRSRESDGAAADAPPAYKRFPVKAVAATP